MGRRLRRRSLAARLLALLEPRAFGRRSLFSKALFSLSAPQCALSFPICRFFFPPLLLSALPCLFIYAFPNYAQCFRGGHDSAMCCGCSSCRPSASGSISFILLPTSAAHIETFVERFAGAFIAEKRPGHSKGVFSKRARVKRPYATFAKGIFNVAPSCRFIARLGYPAQRSIDINWERISSKIDEATCNGAKRALKGPECSNAQRLSEMTRARW